MKNKRYGVVNGVDVYSRDEFVYTARGFGPIEDDVELLAFATKVTYNWSYQNPNTEKTFTNFYLSDYCYAEPFASLTKTEFNRLREIQQAHLAYLKALEILKEWHKVDTIYWADNSVEEVWEDKDGNRKTVVVIGPHGDAC